MRRREKGDFSSVHTITLRKKNWNLKKIDKCGSIVNTRFDFKLTYQLFQLKRVQTPTNSK